MTAQPCSTHAGGTDGQPQPLYGGVEEWVTGQFLPVFRRPLDLARGSTYGPPGSQSAEAAPDTVLINCVMAASQSSEKSMY